MHGRNHDTTCVTCHTGNNFKRCTCYGCNEITRSNVRAWCEEDGNPDLKNWVKCLRSADTELAERGLDGDRRRVRD